MHSSQLELQMDFVTLPQGLFIFYGALVLCCGVSLGVIAGRNWKRRPTATEPQPPELMQRRIALLEQELDVTSAQLQRLLEDRDFMRELRPPRARITAA
jgi:hypothetical protein